MVAALCANGERRDIVNTRQELDGIFKALLDVETGTRGYVITGDKQFLEPLNNTTTNLSARFDRLVDIGSTATRDDESRRRIAGETQAASISKSRVISAVRKF